MERDKRAAGNNLNYPYLTITITTIKSNATASVCSKQSCVVKKGLPLQTVLIYILSNAMEQIFAVSSPNALM